jgi:hypothetical protein
MKANYMKKKIWEKLTKEQLAKYVKESKSLTELAFRCGYKSAGQGFTQMKQMLRYYKFDISHFLTRDKGFNSGNHKYGNYFRYGNAVNKSSLSEELIKIRGRKCEHCGASSWFEQPIPLEVHHKDGNNLNNRLDNLELLCPNCHALTTNWRGHNIKNRRVSEGNLLESLKSSNSIREALIKVKLSPRGGNYDRAKKLISKYNLTNIKDTYNEEILQIDPTTNTIVKIWKNLNTIITMFGHGSSIQHCLMGYTKTACNYIWKRKRDT